MSCSCGTHADSFIVKSGPGIKVTGSGTPNDPYLVTSLTNDLSNFFRVQDTPTVDLNFTGSGTANDPILLVANSRLALTGLSDVADPGGSPAIGESPVWVGSGSSGHWEFQIPPISPAGATNVTGGLQGTGAPGDPVTIKTSGTWGVGPLAGLGADTTIGAVVYVDATGKVRSQPATSVAWDGITGKPTVFPPDVHTHTVSQISDLTTNGNAAKVNGVKISSTLTSAVPPASPTVGDLWFFPKGS